MNKKSPRIYDYLVLRLTTDYIFDYQNIELDIMIVLAITNMFSDYDCALLS